MATDLPAPSSSTSTIGPIIGVVDGSDAAPGEVGEFLVAIGTFNYNAGVGNIGSLNMINMPPGDWDIYTSANFSTIIGSALFELSPIPTGMSNALTGEQGNFAPAGEEVAVIIGQPGRGSFAEPTMLTFHVEVDQALTPPLPAGMMNLRVEARRRR